MRSASILAVCLTLAGAAGGCGDDETTGSGVVEADGGATSSPSGGRDGGAASGEPDAPPPPPAPPAALALTVDPPALTVAQGGATPAKVTVTRTGVSGNVHVSAKLLPPGVKGASADLFGGASAGTIELSADPSAPTGEAEIEIVAMGAADDDRRTILASVTVKLTVVESSSP